MRLNQKLTAAVLAAGMGATMLFTPVAARASEEGRRNTTLALGAAAAVLLLGQRNKIPGIIAAAGAAIAYKRYQDARNDRRYRDGYGSYYGGYDNGYYGNRYDTGYYGNQYDSGYYGGQYDDGYYGQESHHGKDNWSHSQNNPYRDSAGSGRYSSRDGELYRDRAEHRHDYGRR